MTEILKKYYWLWIIVIFNLLVLFPTLLLGLPDAHDSTPNYLSVYFFSQQFWEGDLLPRMLIDHSGGIGLPVHYYYPISHFYITALISPLFDLETQTGQIISIVILMAFIAGSAGVFIFTRQFASEKAALVAALFYSIIPYRIVVDLTFRGAFSELFAMGLVPFLFLPISYWTKAGAGFMLVPIAIISMILLSHPPSAIIAMPFAIMTSLYFLIRGNNLHGLKDLIFIYANGFLLSAFYTLPAVFDQSTNFSKIWTTQYSINDTLLNLKLLYALLFTKDAFIFQIIINTILSTTAFLIASFYLFRQKKNISLLTLTTIQFLITLILMFDISTVIYEYTPFLERIQFPFRFHIMMCLLLSIYLGLVYDVRKKTASSLLLLFFVSLTIYGSYAQTQVKPMPHTSQLKQEEYDYDLSHHAGYYLEAHEKIRGKKDIMNNLIHPSNTTSITTWSDTEIIFDGHFRKGQSFELKRAYMSYWESENKSVSVEKSSLGLVKVNILQNIDSFRLERRPLKLETLGNYISIGTLVFIIAYLFLNNSRRERIH